MNTQLISKVREWLNSSFLIPDDRDARIYILEQCARRTEEGNAYLDDSFQFVPEGTSKGEIAEACAVVLQDDFNVTLEGYDYPEDDEPIDADEYDDDSDEEEEDEVWDDEDEDEIWDDFDDDEEEEVEFDLTNDLTDEEEEEEDTRTDEEAADDYEAEMEDVVLREPERPAPVVEGVECRVCGRPLSDPHSVVNGIGPVCAANLEHVTGFDASVDEDEFDDISFQEALVEYKEAQPRRYAEVGDVEEELVTLNEVLDAAREAGHPISRVVKAMGGDTGVMGSLNPHWRLYYIGRRRYMAASVLEHLTDLEDISRNREPEPSTE